MTGGEPTTSSDPLTTITNYHPLSDLLGSGGQPTAEQFALIHKAGYQIVINLALPTTKNALANEGELVTQLGMNFIHIPVQWEQPTISDFMQFQYIMKACEQKKVFIHCGLNMRVSCFLFLYRVIILKMDIHQAGKEITKIWQPNEVWQQFMTDVLKKYNFEVGVFQ